MKTIVIAQCVACGEKREIEQDEIQKGNHPMCNNCFMPMVAISSKIIKEV